MTEKRFDPKKLDKLNDPKRLEDLQPQLIAEKAKLEQPEVIIDLGAGTGFYSIPFAWMYGRCTLYACDISEVMIDWMNEHVAPRYGNIVPLKMNDNSVPLETGVADFLFMINLHHELDSPEKTLEECRRLLKPGGKLVISDWKKEKTEQGPPLEIRLDAGDVEKQLIAAGFEILSTVADLPSNYLLTAEKRL